MNIIDYFRGRLGSVWRYVEYFNENDQLWYFFSILIYKAIKR